MRSKAEEAQIVAVEQADAAMLCLSMATRGDPRLHPSPLQFISEDPPYPHPLYDLRWANAHPVHCLQILYAT